MALLLAAAAGATASATMSEPELANGAEVSDSAAVREVIARIDRGDFRGAEAGIAKAFATATPADRPAIGPAAASGWGW